MNALSELSKTKANIGAYFWLNNRRCQVLDVDSFKGVPHYWFSVVDADKDRIEPLEGLLGWVPVALVGQCELSM